MNYKIALLGNCHRKRVETQKKLKLMRSIL